RAWAAVKLAGMTLEQKVGQLFVDVTYGASAQTPDRRNQPYGATPAARITGAELRAMGINTDLAPVADVNVNPANPVIGRRSFSADSALAARLTGAQVTGYQQESVAASAKHFPGHGDTAVDSHTGLPVITHDPERWAGLDAPPFKSTIAAGVDVIMTGHLAF